jgi:two-component system sensor histidine kinase/response regulator
MKKGTPMDDHSAKATIMVVDDSPANLKLLEEMLRTHDYRVVQFPRGSMALKAAAKNPPDLILLDIMMPEMDGFEVCQQLKADENLKHIPVLFISGLDGTNDKIKAFAAGGLDYVTKPFQEAEVLARVKTHIELHRQKQRIEIQNQQLKEDHDQLCRLETLRDNMVHMIVHDLRSPLAGILGYAEILATEMERLKNEKSEKFARQILSAGGRLREMVTTLLDVSRMEANEMALDKKPCDLREVVANAITSLGSLVNNSSVLFDSPENEVSAICDPEIIQRVVANLLANAIKFTGRRGKVQISLDCLPRSIRVTISDTGPGIPAQYHKHIFDKFTQVSAHNEGHSYSSGLGLTFSKLAVETHGGQIGVDSEEGKGSTFWFTLPSGSHA